MTFLSTQEHLPIICCAVQDPIDIIIINISSIFLFHLTYFVFNFYFILLIFYYLITD